MTILLNRNQVFIIGIFVIALFLIANRVDFIINSQKKIGKVVYVKSWSGRGGYNTAPIIKFSSDDYEVTFQGETNMDVKYGDYLYVLHKTKDITDVRVYSFVGFWLIPIIWCVIPIMILMIIIVSFLEKNDHLKLEFGKKTFFSKIKSEINKSNNK